jgi:hypothetical protein
MVISLTDRNCPKHKIVANLVTWPFIGKLLRSTFCMVPLVFQFDHFRDAFFNLRSADQQYYTATLWKALKSCYLGHCPCNTEPIWQASQDALREKIWPNGTKVQEQLFGNLSWNSSTRRQCTLLRQGCPSENTDWRLRLSWTTHKALRLNGEQKESLGCKWTTTGWQLMTTRPHLGATN